MILEQKTPTNTEDEASSELFSKNHTLLAGELQTLCIFLVFNHDYLLHAR